MSKFTVTRSQGETNFQTADAEARIESRRRLHYFLCELREAMSADARQLRDHFDAVLKPDVDDYIASLPELRRLHTVLVDIPTGKLRDAFSGWLPDLEQPTDAEALAQEHDDPFQHAVVSIEPLNGGCEVDQRWMCEDGTNAVRVVIRAGTSKVDAIQELQTMLDHLRASNWRELIGGAVERD